MARSSWIIAVGDEVLSGHTADSNSHFLAGRLRATPYPVSRIVVVPDRVSAIVPELSLAAAGSPDRVFCFGGLGPTPDDRTYEAIADFLGVPLVEDPATMERIRARTEDLYRQGRLAGPEPNPGNRKMTLVPEGSLVLRNPVGSAPPTATRLPGKGGARWLIALPGVPAELRAIVDQEVLPRFCAGGPALAFRELRYSGVAESQFYGVLTELGEEFPQVSFGSYPQPGRGGLVIRVSSSDGAQLSLALTRLRELRPPA
ncbi:MAG: molybdopterin-binding protein [Candidatus Dormibacteraeota bacterium]|nr:molybdopterin-binding protein [Candidatus Dormibacteraeota bacterium]